MKLKFVTIRFRPQFQSTCRTGIALSFLAATAVWSQPSTAPVIEYYSMSNGSFWGLQPITVGQSFTIDSGYASFNLTDISFLYRDANETIRPGNVPVTITLFAGTGYGGTPLGSSSQVLTDYTEEFKIFPFPDIPLTPGSAYSFRLVGGGYHRGGYSSGNDGYAGGTKLDENGNTWTQAQDLAFQIFGFGLLGPPPEQLSAITTGLPMANALVQILIAGNQTVTDDLNGHIFRLIAGDGGEAIPSDDCSSAKAKTPIPHTEPRTRPWDVFTTVNFGYADLDTMGTQAGVRAESWAPGVGIERHLTQGFAAGCALSFLQSRYDYSADLGKVDLDGPALSAYLTFVRGNYWSSLLYSFGIYDLDTTRNPGFGFPVAKGSTRSQNHILQYQTGWNFRLQNGTLVTGPIVGIDWLHGTLDAYSENGGGAAALRYDEQSYESLITRVGWTASKKVKTDFADITPQVRFAYERQNLRNDGATVSLIGAPFTGDGGSKSPGQDYLSAGAGVNFAFSDQLGLMVNYQGQFFRSDMNAHFGSLRLNYSF